MQQQHTANENNKAAADRRWLASYLLRRSTVIVPRFLHFYRRVQQHINAWSRPERRVLWRRPAAKVASALAGVALLLALSHAPARAAEITVAAGAVEVKEDDVCSLIEAIINANNGARTYYDCIGGDPGPDTIKLTNNGPFILTESLVDYEGKTALPLITSEITIEGNGATILRDPDALDPFRFFAINSNGDLTLNNLTLQGGHSLRGGGALFNNGTLTITNSVIHDNYAIGDGGAIYNEQQEATLTITNSTLSGNETQTCGGAIHNDRGTVTITNSVIYDNYADDEGGAIYNEWQEATLTIINSTISGNEARSNGGAIDNEHGTVTITGSIINENDSGDEGGAIYNDFEDATLTITNSTLSGNRADYAGGAINNWGGSVTIIGSTLSYNYGGLSGGAIYNDHDETTLTIINSTISNNEAADGGGLYNWEGIVTITNSTITGNVAGVEGGGVYNDRGSITFNHTIVSGNKADVANEIYNFGGTIHADNYNLFGHSGENDPAAFGGFAPGAMDIKATNDGSGGGIALTDILDLDLDDHGGPTAGAPWLDEPILTHALVENSPAIDAAPSAACEDEPVNTLDQRDFLRNVDGRNDGDPEGKECDIGAFEYNSVPAQDVYMTAAGPGVTDDGVAFGQEDILFWDGLIWSKFFDGTDQGLTNKHDINAIHVNAADDIYLSFFQNKIKTTNLGPVLGQDILHYDGSGFSLFFDGSDVGLTTTAEKIDALHILDGDVNLPGGGSCDAYLLISTLGTGKVPTFGGGQLSFQGEDILGFCLTNSGENTAGFWHMVLDGSAEGMPKNSTDSISASDDGETILLTTKGTFNVDGAFGGHSMIYVFDTNNDEFDGPFFSAPATGLNQKVDGLHADEELLN